MLVSILAVGEISYKKDALEVLTHYLDKHDKRYKIVESVNLDTRGSHPSWWKLLCHKVHPGEDYILNWDLDLLPSGPNVPFHDIQEDKLGMAWDTSAKYLNERYNRNFRYNGGLIGIPCSQQDFCEEVFRDFAPGTRPSYEQYYLNDRLVERGIEVQEFKDTSNFLYRDNNQEVFSMFLKSDFKHYTCHNRNPLIKKHKELYFLKT